MNIDRGKAVVKRRIFFGCDKNYVCSVFDDETASFALGLLESGAFKPHALKAHKKVLCHLRSGKWHRKILSNSNRGVEKIA